MICSYLNAAPLVYLTKSIVSQTSFETAPNNWSAGDDSSISVSIGFAFPFNGTTYTSVWINSNGMLSFSSSNTAYSNANIPYSQEPSSIYPYWDDLNRNNGGTITYGNPAGSPDEFIVSWENVPHYPNSGSYSLQVILYSNGNIRFRYGSGDTSGSSATVGVQENTNNYDEHSYNSSATLDESKDILYSTTGDANLSLSKSSCVLDDPVNGTSKPKRIAGATIRYAIEVQNTGSANADDVILTDNLDAKFDYSSIENLQIQSGACDCASAITTSNNGPNGSANGVNPVKLDFETILSGSSATPTIECGYFEVKIK